MSNENEMEQTMQALEMAKMRLESLGKDAELLQSSLTEHARAIETLKALSTTKEGNDILIPVGAGAFIPAKATGANWAMIGIGAGLTVEKKFDEAVAALEKDAAEIELQERKMITEMKNLEKQTGALQQRFRQLQQAAMAPEPPGGQGAVSGHVHGPGCDHDHDDEQDHDHSHERGHDDRPAEMSADAEKPKQKGSKGKKK